MIAVKLQQVSLSLKRFGIMTARFCKITMLWSFCFCFCFCLFLFFFHGLIVKHWYYVYFPRYWNHLERSLISSKICFQRIKCKISRRPCSPRQRKSEHSLIRILRKMKARFLTKWKAVFFSQLISLRGKRIVTLMAMWLYLFPKQYASHLLQPISSKTAILRQSANISVKLKIIKTHIQSKFVGFTS